MSRCFQFPPPGRPVEETWKEALIERIKIQEEREKAKEEKSKRREEERKTREKKKKTNEALEKSYKSVAVDTKDWYEQLEKSSVTEEHGLPTSSCIPISSPESVSSKHRCKRRTNSSTSLQRVLSECENLLQNWVPLPLEAVKPCDDEDWLFNERSRDIHRSKRLKYCSNNTSISCGSTMWPRTQLLIEGDIYALPFTVPF